MANKENGQPNEEERDPYTILNLSRDCTDDEIQRCFKLLSRNFHPDKHPPTTRQDAQDVFVAFKNAHDLLVDPVLRQVYDAFGHRGIRLVKLSLHSPNADALYPTLLEQHQAGNPHNALQIVQEALQNVELEHKEDAVQLSAVLEYACALDSLDSLPDLSSAKLQVSVTSDSTSNYSVTMGGSTRVKYGDGTGAGNILIGYKPAQGTDVTLDIDLSPTGTLGLALGSTRVLVDRTVMTTTVRTQPNSDHLSLSVVTHRALWENQCRGTWAVGMGTDANLQYCLASLTTLNEDYPQCTAKVNVGVSKHPIELSSKYNMGDNRQISFSVAFGGSPSVEWKAMLSRELTNYCKLRVGARHAISTGLTWIFELERGSVKFRVPVAISTALLQQDWARWVFFLTVPFAIDDLLGDVVKQVSPIKEPSSSLIKDSKLLQSIKTKEEADMQVRMMKKAAEARRDLEQEANGLVIVHATYFVEGGKRFDATIPIQFWVRNSHLRLSSSPKSTLLGFYDLVTPTAAILAKRRPWWKLFWSTTSTEQVPPNLVPKLLVRYSYQGDIYEITIQDTEPLLLPSERAVELGPITRIL